MTTKKPLRKKRAPAKKSTTPRVVKTSPKAEAQGHHLASWLLMWTMFACALVVSIAALTQVDWKWLTSYAYEQTHQEEIAQDLLIQALDKATCEMAASASAASEATCAALGFTAPSSTAPEATSTSSTR
ncbi:MAG: hypothetical protein KC582_01190 [Candidatus Magasanikbacteria bacterium]|nr:hypothetical protein [Candidatus Magasanikbacteria bacterium]